MDVDFCLSSPQGRMTPVTTSNDSGGTDLHEPLALKISSLSSMDLDTSSDDGEQLQTPVNVVDPQQLVHIAYAPGLGGTLAVASDSKPDTGDPQNYLASMAQARSFVTPPKNATSPYKDFLGIPDSSSCSSPLSEPGSDMLCTTIRLDSSGSFNSHFNDSTLDLYSNSTSSLDVPPASRTKGTNCLQTGYSILEADSLSLLSELRKRSPSNENPLLESHPDRRPKYGRAHASEYTPSILGSSYSARFPTGHRLRSDFIHQYELEAELGAGGYGFVMAARYRPDGQEVAVKFILKDKIPKHGWIKDDKGRRVPKEALLLSIVNHPGIVKFYDLFEDNDYFYLVQELHGTPWKAKKKFESQTRQLSKFFSNDHPDEKQCPDIVTPAKLKQYHAYTPANTPIKDANREASHNLYIPDDPFAMDGRSLLPQPAKSKTLARPTFIRRPSHDLFECIEQSKYKRFGEKDAKYIFSQVVEVVEYLDSLGISHCDLKDENIVIDNNLKIKIIDFGSVVFADPREPRPYYRRFFGTAAYASPEIIDEKPYQAAPAEVWALGILLSFLVTGLSPFRSEEDKRIGRFTLEDVHARRMSRDCHDLLKKCLEVDPDKRATIAEVRDHPWLASVINGEQMDQ